MAISLNTTLRNNRADQITSFAGASAKLRIYTAAYAALLVECVCSSALAAAAASGRLTLNAVSTGTAGAAGVAAIARIVKADGSTMVIEGLTVGTSGTNIVITNTNIGINDTVSVTTGGASYIDEGNA